MNQISLNHLTFDDHFTLRENESKVKKENIEKLLGTKSLSKGSQIYSVKKNDYFKRNTKVKKNSLLITSQE